MLIRRKGRVSRRLPVADVTVSADPLLSASVVIATRHRAGLLSRCLTAVDQLDPKPNEVVVVDNSAGDEETRAVAHAHGASYVKEPRVGLSRARNTGARAAHHAVLALIDDDAIPESSWLAALVRPFADTNVMAVTGRIVPLERTTAAQRLSVETGWIDLGDEPRSIDCTHPLWFEISNFGGLGLGGNMAIRREVYRVWPGFRESIGRGTAISGCEEHYAFFELLKLGYRVVYTPDAVVAHPHPDTVEVLVSTHRRSIAETFAYATLLLVEEPGYRARTLGYILRRAAGGRQPWHVGPERATAPLLARRHLAAAAARGPVLYARSRRSDP